MNAAEIAPPVGETELPGSEVELPGGGRALFTDRSHGNMSSVGGKEAEGGLAARERLRERCGIAALVRGYQVHGTVVGCVYVDGARRGTPAGADDLADARRLSDGPLQPSFRADGHACAAEGVAAMVLAADCLPVVLGARGAVAALHAGWRGLAAGVLEEGVRALREVGGSGDVVAVLGPCAGRCCYEVGEEVHAAFVAEGPDARAGRNLDLKAIARRQLGRAGVEEVHDPGLCTICSDPSLFFSHRRDHGVTGRQAGIAWLS